MSRGSRPTTTSTRATARAARTLLATRTTLPSSWEPKRQPGRCGSSRTFRVGGPAHRDGERLLKARSGCHRETRSNTRHDPPSLAAPGPTRPPFVVRLRGVRTTAVLSRPADPDAPDPQIQSGAAHRVRAWVWGCSLVFAIPAATERT